MLNDVYTIPKAKTLHYKIKSLNEVLKNLVKSFEVNTEEINIYLNYGLWSEEINKCSRLRSKIVLLSMSTINSRCYILAEHVSLKCDVQQVFPSRSYIY